MVKQHQYIKKKEIFSKDKELPKLPGVYKFYDIKNNILYIGKAKNLSNRLKSYLTISKDRKKNELIDKIKFLEIFLTKTESDALLLEQNLIRKFKPPFNVQFRDDKSFPAIYFSSNHDFPGIYLTRNQKLKDVAIFGSNDHTCFGFMKAAIESDFKIPRDFIIAGYDNLSFCDTFTPELTSVATNFDVLGKRAIRTIENMVSDSNEIMRQFSMVPVEIIIRTSTQTQ